jgi:hypothetical protein
MKNSILILAGAFLLPQVYVQADEIGARIDARVSAMREARASTAHLQHEIHKTGSAPKPINLARPTVGTAIEPTIVNKVLKEPVLIQQRDTTKLAETHVLVVQQQLKTAVDPVQKAALQQQLKTNVTALNTEKATLRKTLIEETRKEISKAAKTRNHH